MKYTVYKITNNITNNIYIGVHKTNNLNDGYMGSGELIKKAIKKHGIENFTKEYIKIFDNPDDMFNMESELVDEEFVKRGNTYNMRTGGFGGFSDEDRRKSGDKQKQKYDSDEDFRKRTRKQLKEGFDKAREDGRINFNTFEGKQHTEESKQKIGEANSKHQTGKGNSNYGKCWIHHPELKQSKPIPRFELPKWESEGWVKGRKIKW